MTKITDKSANYSSSIAKSPQESKPSNDMIKKIDAPSKIISAPLSDKQKKSIAERKIEHSPVSNHGKSLSENSSARPINIENTFEVTHTLNKKIIDSIHEKLIHDADISGVGKSIADDTNDILLTLAPMNGHPDAIAVLKHLEHHLQQTEALLKKKSRGIKWFTASQHLLDNKQQISAALTQVKESLSSQGIALDGQFEISSSAQGGEEITGYIKDTIGKYEQSEGIAQQFIVDAKREHFILKDKDYSYDSKESTREATTDELVAEFKKYMTNSSEKFRFLVSALISQTAGNAMAAGLAAHDAVLITGDVETSVTFKTGKIFCEVRRREDNSLSFDYKVQGLNILIHRHAEGKVIQHGKDSGLVMHTSFTIPNEGKVDDIVYGPTSYTFSLPDPHYKEI